MANALQKRQLTADDQRILGKLIVEGLNGEITEETRDELKKLGNHLELPEPYGHLVGYLRGYDTDGKHLAAMLVDELRIVGMERLEARTEGPHPLGVDWIVMYSILEVMLEGGDGDLRAEADLNAEMGTDIANIDHVPAWAQSLVKHINRSKTQGDELTLQLLNILEAQIEKRRAELENTP
jgi:hypothetical protein